MSENKTHSRAFLASRAILAGLLLLNTVACQKIPQEKSGFVPKAHTTPTLPVVDETRPAAAKTTETLFATLTENFEFEIAQASNGYILIEPLLEEPWPEDFGGQLFEFDLDGPENKAVFDKNLLPIIKRATSQEYFVSETQLRAGRLPVNYRGLRFLMQLTATRARQIWEEGDKERALGLVALPLSLFQKMGQKPETASANLFAASYAEMSVSLLRKWGQELSLDPETRRRMTSLLAVYSPSFERLKGTVSVDFAQLTNSLKSEESRESLGVGNPETETLQLWHRELLNLHGEALKLYEHKAVPDIEIFNDKVREADVLIQGLVIDYPRVSAVQKHFFAKYKAAEIGLALLGPRAGEYKNFSSSELYRELFPNQGPTIEALESLLRLDVQSRSIRVLGAEGHFELLAPGTEPVLFESYFDLDQAGNEHN